MALVFNCALVVVFVMGAALAMPNGAPLDACKDMTPQHGRQAQSSVSPYATKVSKVELLSNGSLELTLQADSGTFFRGFLLMAFDESGDKTPIGTFSSTSDADNARTLNCLGVPKSAVTHSHAEDKESVSVVWNPPSDFEGSVTFKTTYVKEKRTFWVAQKSDVVRVKKAAPSSAESETTTATTTTTTTTKAPVAGETTTKKPGDVNSHVDIPSTTAAPPSAAPASSTIGSVVLYAIVIAGITVALMA